MKKTEAAKAAWESRRMGPSGRTAVSAAKEMATGTNRVVLGDRLKAAAEGGGSEEEMADVEEGEAAGETKDVTMAETATATAATTTTTTAIETETGTKTKTGALATND